MRIFLTGATGFIGSALAIRILEEGHELRALVRTPAKAEKLARRGATLIQGDLADRAAIQEAMRGCSHGFHLAAYAKAWAPEARLFDTINYQGGLNVLEMALEQGLERLVLTSTGGVIGDSGEGLANEQSQADPSTMTLYEKSKARLEAVLPRFMDRGLKVVTVNPARVFGPGAIGDSNGEVMVMQRYLSGKFRFLPGDGHATASYCYIDDVVEGHLLALEKGRPGERYILGGENATYRQFFDTIGELAGRKYSMYPIPLRALQAFAQLQVWYADNFNGYPLITPELVRKYGRNWSFSSAKAEQELGYQYRNLEESVGLTLEWLREKEPR